MFNAAQPGRNHHVGDVLDTRKREDQERLGERRLGRVGGRNRDPQRGEQGPRKKWGRQSPGTGLHHLSWGTAGTVVTVSSPCPTSPTLCLTTTPPLKTPIRRSARWMVFQPGWTVRAAGSGWGDGGGAEGSQERLGGREPHPHSGPSPRLQSWTQQARRSSVPCGSSTCALATGSCWCLPLTTGRGERSRGWPSRADRGRAAG